MIPWLPEPLTDDQAYADHGEHILDWLLRSTNPRAVECRRFLNENIADYPENFQVAMQKALRNRWHSAFFELVVARTLQEMGSALGVEEVLSDGKRPDFTARFSDGAVIVEANAPIINSDMKEEMKRNDELITIIDSCRPKGWYVIAYQLPNIGYRDSKKKFKKAVQEILSIPPPLSNDQVVDIKREIDSGIIDLCLHADDLHIPGSASGPVLTVLNDAHLKIGQAVKNKRRQVRNAQYPVLLAIQGESLFTELEDFDRALFGNTVEQFDRYRISIGKKFDESGVLMPRSNHEPVFAGVLVFREVSFPRCLAPVLYWHPRTTAVLPKPFNALEQRFYDKEAQAIRSIISSNPNLMDGLHCVNPTV